MSSPVYPSLYAMLVPWLREIAIENGYALALHGSLRRDLDVVAVPWTDDAVTAHRLVEAILEKLGGYVDEATSPEVKPHGRLAWSIILASDAFIDLSVMPRSTLIEAMEVSE